MYSLLHDELASDIVIWKYAYDDKIIKRFIRNNFKEGRKSTAKIPVNKNNFTFVYYDWVKTVKPSIQFNWDKYTKKGVLDCDFYLADLMSVDDCSLRESLKVVLEKTKYKILQNIDGDELFQEIAFNDGMVAYRQFWNRYQRPPKPVYQKYILDRRDLLVPQDIREVKGSYYTPERWVRKAQEYLEMVLGENWQEEYYVWDCAAGSGNLLRGLTNKYNVFASTLDDSDVKVMHDAIDDGRLSLVKKNVFQFDFLNDDFSKCPESLQKILSDEDKRTHLVILINPPYGEAGSRTTVSGTGHNKTNISVQHKTYQQYLDKIGIAGRELYAQFFARIVNEIPHCILSAFSTLKMLTGPNFRDFRNVFLGTFLKGFIVPAATFDNISGNFPIGFLIWDLSRPKKFMELNADVYDADGTFICSKTISSYENSNTINDWIIKTRNRPDEFYIGFMSAKGCDFQNVNYNFIVNQKSQLPHPRGTWVSDKNIFEIAVYYSVVHCIPASWLNDRDLFLHPNNGWHKDNVFVTDCLIFTLFHNQNRIESKNGINHWIPFYEDEVASPGTFDSRFMADVIHGKVLRYASIQAGDDLFAKAEEEEAINQSPLDSMSDEARAVYLAGKNLWQYYMLQPGANPNASFYDIKAHFQGFKETASGKEMMNSDSSDSHYSELFGELKVALKCLTNRIEPKIYEYGFLL